MPHRIIYCALSCASLLSVVSHEVLRNFDQGVIASVSDEAMSKLLIKEPEIPILYFSRPAYEQAVQGLEDSEIEAVLRQRRQYWAPNAAGHGLNWIYQAERRCLTLTALAQTKNSGGAGVRMSDHFEQTLQLLVIISGEARYHDLSMASLLVLVVEGEAKLREEFLDAQDVAKRAGDSHAAAQFVEGAKRNESYGKALGSSLKSLGRPEYSQGMPNLGLSRGIFLRPSDRALVSTLEAHKSTYMTWRDGLVADWALDDIPELEKRGQSVQILYLNGGQLQMDLHDLTPAQRDREFAKRLDAGRGSSLEARREHLSSLWLEQHLLRRKAHAQAKTHHEAVAAMLARQIADETLALRQELAMFPAWLEEGEKSGRAVLETLKRGEEQVLQDARFFAALCKGEGDANGEALFKKISGFKPAQP